MNKNKNREQRASIAQETLAILERGSYINAHGEVVSIKAELAYAVQHSVHYTTEKLNAMVLQSGSNKRYVTCFEVRNESTLSAARRQIQDGAVDVLCLNFASAKNPGGGFLGGSEAQEENLAKSSGLYPCIVQMKAMYDANRSFGSCTYLDDMIYTPKVPVFRDDDYELSDAHYLASFVTAPAVNRGALARNEPARLADVEEIMMNRVDLLLKLALQHGHSHLVLGAWGCGVFGNDAKDMARYFSAHLIGNPNYQGAFKQVSFAVLDRSNNGTFLAFQETFK